MYDFPSDEANCGNCTRKGGHCARTEKQFPNGYILNSQTKEISGIIYSCPNYTGPFEKLPLWNHSQEQQ